MNTMPLIQALLSPMTREWLDNYDRIILMAKEERERFLRQNVKPIALLLDNEAQNLRFHDEDDWD